MYILLTHACDATLLQQTAFAGVNAAAVGLMYTAVYMLWQIALSITVQHGRTARPVGDSSLYVVLVGCSFLAVGIFNVPAPAAIVAGGCVGLLDWLLHS
jgi:hypothetical protein